MPDSPPEFTPIDRRALASVAVQFFVNGAAFASFIPRLPEIRDQIGVTLGEIGVLITLSLGIGMLGSISVSRLVDRFGTKTTLTLGAIVLLAALPVVGVARTPLVFVLAYGLMSICDVIVDVTMNLQGSWLSARRHAPVMNRLHGLWSLGTVVGSVIAAQLASRSVSLELHLVVVAVVLLGSLVFVSRGLLREDEHVAEVTSLASSGSGDAGRSGSRRKLRPSVLPLVLFAVSGGVAITVELTSSDWAAFRLAEDFEASAGFAGLGFVAFTSGMTVGRFGGDWAVARVGGDRSLRGAIVVAGIGLAGAGLAPNEWVVLASYAVAGLGISMFFPKLYDDAAQHRGRRGAGLAWMTAGSRFTGLLIPAIVGGLAATSLSVGSATAMVTLPCVAFFFVVNLPAVRRRVSSATAR